MIKTVIPLYSEAMRQITSSVSNYMDPRNVFTLENQQLAEPGVDDFVTAVGISGDWTPSTQLDFYGPFGMYAWEIFYYIPMLLSSKYLSASQYPYALNWIQYVYNPQAEDGSEWNFQPFLDGISGSVDGLTDPDEIATRQPIQYQISTLRHYLNILIQQGDDYYRQCTTETLRVAKMCYIVAQDLFLRETGDFLTRSTRQVWANPTLGEATKENFLPPYNDVMRDLYNTIEDRIRNLRNWCSIDGDPLNIPLIAPPIDPKQLETAALSGIPPAQASSVAQQTLPFPFEVVLEKAKSVVKNFMYLGDLLERAMKNNDAQTLALMQADLAQFVVEELEVGGQSSLIGSLQQELNAQKKDKEEAQTYYNGYTKFANEFTNDFENAGQIVQVSVPGLYSAALLSSQIEGAFKYLPCIFGLADGGFHPEAAATAAKEGFEYAADVSESCAETLLQLGEFQRRQEENQMESDASLKAVQSIEASIDKLKYDIDQGQGTLTTLQQKLIRVEQIQDFQRSRSTNQQFFQWYLGQMKSLYNSAYDIASRYAMLAQQSYREDTADATATFVNPSWNSTYNGLLSGQSLMLDLQRMDYAKLSAPVSTDSNDMKAFKMKLSDDGGTMRFLKKAGQAIFSVDETKLNKWFPEELDRRIQSVRVQLQGIDESLDDVNGVLALLGHKRNFNRDNSTGNNSWSRVTSRNRISLRSAYTNTAKMRGEDGRFRPFERCGVDSTWMLSFPRALSAAKDKREDIEIKEMLESLEDVVLTVLLYSART